MLLEGEYLKAGKATFCGTLLDVTLRFCLAIEDLFDNEKIQEEKRDKIRN